MWISEVFMKKKQSILIGLLENLKDRLRVSLFERLLLSRGNINKEQLLALAAAGNSIMEPADIIRDPYVFEFLGVPEDKPMLESDLEKALVQRIENFLLELGRGFMFVGTQQRVTINNNALLYRYGILQ